MGQRATGVYVVTSQYEVVSFNDELRSFLPKIKVGEKCYACLHDSDEPCVFCPIAHGVVGPHAHFFAERQLPGVVEAIAVPFPDGETGHIVTISVDDPGDIPLGTIDVTTGLLSRSGFRHYCSDYKLSDRTHRVVTIAIDIVGFLAIESQYGGNAADGVVQYVAKRLAELDAVFSYSGGGRFIGVMEVESLDGLPFLELALNDIEKGASVASLALKAGVFSSSDDDKALYSLVKYAEFALNSIRMDDACSFKVLDLEEYQSLMRENEAAAEIVAAIKNREFKIFFQPKCEIETGSIVGAEALARWVKPDGTLVSPAVFIPLLEKRNLIHELDLYVWELAFATMSEWMSKGIDVLPVSVNVSRRDVAELDIVNTFVTLAKDYDVAPHLIEIEMTETAFVENEGGLRDTIHSLRSHGFHVLIDDFGSGYSSLAMLKDYEADILKLDMCFLRSDFDSSRSVEIIQSVLDMAHKLDMYVIAEGIETREQADLLSGLGFQYAQGYYFYRPMACSDFEELLCGVTSSMIPSGYHGSHSSLEKRIGDYFWRIAEVNVVTGAYRFIRNEGDPDFMAGPRARTIEERFERYVAYGMVHPDDIERLGRAVDIRSIHRDILNGAHRERCSFRVRENDGWRWVVLEILLTEDYSEESPWVLFTWKDAADDISKREDVERMIMSSFNQVVRINLKTGESELVRGSGSFPIRLEIAESGLPRFVEDFIAEGIVYPRDVSALREFLLVSRLNAFFAHGGDFDTMAMMILSDETWRRAIIEVRRSVDYSDKNPLILVCLRISRFTENVGESAGEMSGVKMWEQLGNTPQRLQNVHVDAMDKDLFFETTDLLESIPGGFFVYEGYGDERLLYANTEMLRIFKCETMEEFVALTGGTFPGMVHPEDIESTQNIIDIQISDNVAHEDQLLDYVSYRIICRDGTTVWVQDFGRQINHATHGTLYSVFLSEVPDARMDAFRIAQRMGITDLLCDMLNRNSFEIRKNNLLAFEGSAACVFIDLNGLHDLNNKEGHDRGDEALRIVADSVKRRFGENDTFRIGGDEFVALVTDVEEEWVAERLSLVHRDVEETGFSISSGYCYEHDLDDPTVMVTNAEATMRANKCAHYQSRSGRSATPSC